MLTRSILQYFWPALRDNMYFVVFLRVVILHKFYCTLCGLWFYFSIIISIIIVVVPSDR